MQFKSKRIKDEWNRLRAKNKQLYDIVMDIAVYSSETLQKEIVVTSILRTMDEQKEIYGYAKESVHLYWRGVDLRSWMYQGAELGKLLEYLNKKYDYDPERPGQHKVDIHHNVGRGQHIHLQNHPNTKCNDKSCPKAINLSTFDNIISIIKAIFGIK